jgi:hypothetical protein
MRLLVPAVRCLQRALAASTGAAHGGSLPTALANAAPAALYATLVSQANKGAVARRTAIADVPDTKRLLAAQPAVEEHAMFCYQASVWGADHPYIFIRAQCWFCAQALRHGVPGPPL